MHDINILKSYHSHYRELTRIILKNCSENMKDADEISQLIEVGLNLRVPMVCIDKVDRCRFRRMPSVTNWPDQCVKNTVLRIFGTCESRSCVFRRAPCSNIAAPPKFLPTEAFTKLQITRSSRWTLFAPCFYKRWQSRLSSRAKRLNSSSAPTKIKTNRSPTVHTSEHYSISDQSESSLRLTDISNSTCDNIKIHCRFLHKVLNIEKRHKEWSMARACKHPFALFQKSYTTLRDRCDIWFRDPLLREVWLAVDSLANEPEVCSEGRGTWLFSSICIGNAFRLSKNSYSRKNSHP